MEEERIINEIKKYDNFGIKEYYDLISKYNEIKVLSAFKSYLKACDKDNINDIIAKYSFAFITIDLQAKKLNESDIENLFSRYDSVNVINYFMDVTSSDIAREILKDNYEVINNYLSINDSGFQKEENNILYDDNYKQYLKSLCNHKILSKEEEQTLFKLSNENKKNIKIMNLDNNTFNNIYLLFSSINNKNTYNKLFKASDYVNEENKKLITRYRLLYKNNNNMFPSIKNIEKEFNCSINENFCYDSAYLDNQLDNIINYIKCRNKLIESNQKIVCWVAKKYFRSDISCMDIIEEGNIGLMTAINKFDYTKNYRFSTYSIWWIREAIIRSINDKYSMIRVPINSKTRIEKYKELINQKSSSSNKAPKDEEMAELLNITTEKIKEMKEAIAKENVLSTDVKIEDNNTRFIENVLDIGETPYEYASRKDTIEILKKVLNRLPDNYNLVLRLRYNLIDYTDTVFVNYLNNCITEVLNNSDENAKEKIKEIISKLGSKELTLIEIATILNVVRQRVYQIETNGIKKLNHEMKRIKIRSIEDITE